MKNFKIFQMHLKDELLTLFHLNSFEQGSSSGCGNPALYWHGQLTIIATHEAMLQE